MLKHEFYRKYANTPLANRLLKIKYGGKNKSLNEIYWEMKTADDAIRVEERAQEELLSIAQYAEIHMEIFNFK